PDQIQTEQLESKDPARKSLVLRKPLGVIAVISPWNFTFHLSLRSVATAIACGNTVVLKPASDTPVTGGTLIGKLFEEAGLPAGT
ncbi:aldehyde dehydrogenase family protein, partial [Klebsiella pneumoniae]|uniref:aldehyde dehydrogenase family protein n=1 Tax=Klebsiella pneumoniae TaxID=573 RepID=UPI0013310BD6